MDEITELLNLTKQVAIKAGQLFRAGLDGKRDYEFSRDIRREVKAKADDLLNTVILDQLRSTGLPILSEESGMLPGSINSGLRFIVDPLDGTVNFVRDLGSSAISIALWRDQIPVFGVVCRLPDLAMAWGGPDLGAFFDDKPISVSSISNKEHAVLCTGIPARLDISSPAAGRRMVELLQSYGKVRMLGAASLSLLQVAKGSADAYAEQEVMLWDVAAGLALVEGAGGRVAVVPGISENAVDVFASNGYLPVE